MASQQKLPGTGKAFFTVYTCCVLIFNVIIIAQALEKGGWGALGLLYMVGPIFNGICLVVGAIAVLILNSRTPNGAPGTYWMQAFLLPFVCAFIDIIILFSGITGGGC
jgi:hypothetical protein